jgi:hypothetical protein
VTLGVGVLVTVGVTEVVGVTVKVIVGVTVGVGVGVGVGFSSKQVPQSLKLTDKVDTKSTPVEGSALSIIS